MAIRDCGHPIVGFKGELPKGKTSVFCLPCNSQSEINTSEYIDAGANYNGLRLYMRVSEKRTRTSVTAANHRYDEIEDILRPDFAEAC